MTRPRIEDPDKPPRCSCGGKLWVVGPIVRWRARFRVWCMGECLAYWEQR